MSFLSGILGKVRNEADNVGSFFTGQPAHGQVNIRPLPQPAPAAPAPNVHQAPLVIGQASSLPPMQVGVAAPQVLNMGNQAFLPSTNAVTGVADKQVQTNPFKYAFHAETHNPVTNFAGAIAKPLAQFPLDASNQLYNRAVAPTFKLPKITLAQTPMAGAAKFVGADGSLHQTVGSGIQTGLTLATGGLSNLAEKGAVGLGGMIAPKAALTTINAARLGLPALEHAGLNTGIKYGGGALAGAAINGGFGVSSAIGDNAKPSDILKAGFTNAAIGGLLPVSGHLVADSPQIVHNLASAHSPLDESGKLQLPSFGSKATAVKDRLSLTPRISIPEQNALRDYSDHLAGLHVADQETMQLARDAAAKRGVDITSGSRATQLENTNSLLDSIGKPNRPLFKPLNEGGSTPVDGPLVPIGKLFKDKHAKSGVDPLASLKQEALKYKSADEFNKALNGGRIKGYGVGGASGDQLGIMRTTGDNNNFAGEHLSWANAHDLYNQAHAEATSGNSSSRIRSGQKVPLASDESSFAQSGINNLRKSQAEPKTQSPGLNQSATEQRPRQPLNQQKDNASNLGLPQTAEKVNLDRPLSEYEQMVAAQEGLSDKEFLQSLQKKHDAALQLSPEEESARYNEFMATNKDMPTQAQGVAKALPNGTPDIAEFENGDRMTPAEAAIAVASKHKPGTYDQAVKAYMEHSPGIDYGIAQAETTKALEAAGKTPVGGTRGEYANKETPFGMKTLDINQSEAPTGQLRPESTFSKVASLELRANKIGEAGREFTQRVNNVHAEESVIRQQMDDVAKPFYDLSKSDQKIAALVKEGKATTKDPKIREAVAALHQLFPDALQTARVHGLPVGDQGSTYFPHMFEKGKFDKPKEFNAAVEHLVKTGQAPDRAAAVKLMNERKTGDYMGGKIFSNLEKQRELDLPGYRLDASVVRDYNAQFAKRLAETKQFGANNEKINELIQRAASNNQDAQSLQKIVNAYLNPKRVDDNALARSLGHYQSFLSKVQLTKAAVSHLPQGFANIGTQTGFTKYFDSMRKQIFNPESRQFLHDAGFDAEKHDHKTTASNIVTAPGLKQVREFHRATAAIGGREVALGMAERGDEAGLRKFGVAGDLTPDADGKIHLSFEQQVQAAHRLTDRTIFTDSPLQSPAWTQGTQGKFFSQYKKAYVYKQSEYIGSLFKDARQGKVAPLLRYLGIALPVSGAVVTVGKNFIKNPTQNPIPTNSKDAKKFALESLKNSGGLSIGMGAGDAIYNLSQYHRNGNQVWQGIAGAASPGLGTVVQAGQNIAQAKNGNVKPLEKQGLGFVPLIGNHISQAIFPSKPITPDQQAFFDAQKQARTDMSSPQDKRNLAAYNTYFARNKTPDGKTIQLAQEDSRNQWGSLAANPKALGEIQKTQTASKNHNPEWDLKGVGQVKAPDGSLVNVPKMVLYAAYKNLPPGDLQKLAIAQQNPWIQDTENAAAAWSQDNIKSGNSVPAPGYIQYPVQAPGVQDKFTQMTQLSAIPAADRTPDQISQLNAIFKDPDVVKAMHDQQVYTDKVRMAEHLPAIQRPSVESPEVAAGWDAYNAIPKHTGPKGGSPLVSAWINANPDLWAKMSQQSEENSMYNIEKYGGEAYYGANVPDSFLGAIYGVGNYDISKVKNANGTNTYSLLNFLNTNGGDGTGVGANGLPTVNANSANGTAATGHGSAYIKRAKNKKLRIKRVRAPHSYARRIRARKPHVEYMNRTFKVADTPSFGQEASKGKIKGLRSGKKVTNTV